MFTPRRGTSSSAAGRARDRGRPRRPARRPDARVVLHRRRQAREHAEYAARRGAAAAAPVLPPPSVRDFYAFEQHVRNARASRGRGEVPPEWYEIPVFYFSNPAAIYGPEDEIPYPAGSEALDYELEVAAVIGAERQIGGFTVMNDWSARDLQRKEMTRRPRAGEGQGLRDLARAGPGHARRARRPAPGDGRARERRGALAREPRRHVPLVGAILEHAALQHACCGPATCSARARSAPAASSSTATSAGCSPATRSSWRWRGSASCATASARREEIADGARRGQRRHGLGPARIRGEGRGRSVRA